MIDLERAKQLRTMIERLTQNLTNTDALDAIELFPRWSVNTEYKINDRFSYHNKLYRVAQAHTSQSDWLPDSTPALYVEITPPGAIPVWKQPAGAHDAYQRDDKVHYPTENNPIYISIIDNNVWAPNVYGWELSV